MSRRKGRGGRQGRKQQRPPFRLQLNGDDGTVIVLDLPGITRGQFDRVAQFARVGEIHDPVIMRFIRAFSTAIGHDIDAQPWTDADTVAFLREYGLMSEKGWTPLEDAELALLLEEGVGHV